MAGSFSRMRLMDSTAPAVRNVTSMQFNPPASSASASGTASSTWSMTATQTSRCLRIDSMFINLFSNDTRRRRRVNKKLPREIKFLSSAFSSSPSKKFDGENDDEDEGAGDNGRICRCISRNETVRRHACRIAWLCADGRAMTAFPLNEPDPPPQVCRHTSTLCKVWK